MSKPTERPLVKTATKGIYKRGGRYVVVFRDQQGRQRKRAAATLAEARTVKATLTADVARGEFRATSRETFAQYAPRWIASYEGRTKRGVGARTLELYRADLGLDTDGNPTGTGAVAFFGRTLLVEIGPQELKAYGRHLAGRGLARSSVKRALAPVKALLATAHEDGLLRFNPAAGLRNIAPANQDEEAVEKVKALTPDELAEVLARTPERWRLFFEFLAETGCRIGEAIEIRWQDIDRHKGTLTVARQWHRGNVTLPKGRKVRRIPISARLDANLWELRKQTAGADDELVFTAARGGRIDQKNLATRVLKKACADVGEWPTWHTFRHTCATQLFRLGWNPAQVCKMLGHSDAGFTLRTYVHLLDDDLPRPAVLDSITPNGGNTGATEDTETGRNPDETTTLEIAV